MGEVMGEVFSIPSYLSTGNIDKGKEKGECSYKGKLKECVIPHEFQIASLGTTLVLVVLPSVFSFHISVQSSFGCTWVTSKLLLR